MLHRIRESVMIYKTLRFAAVALVLTTPLTAQAGAKTDSLPTVSGSYDPVHDLTSLRIESFPISPQLSLSVLALVSGRLPAAPTVVMFTIQWSVHGLVDPEHHRIRMVTDGGVVVFDVNGWW